MSQSPLAQYTGRYFLNRMVPRDPNEHGRAASMLELFFDLVFVVAILFAGSELHHALTHGHVMAGVLNYALVMFYIWWAWMNFTWFASSFDTDDWLYRLLVIIQMSGVLVIAGNMHTIFDGDPVPGLIGYLIMRFAQVLQWLRASRTPGSTRKTALIYTAGITLVQAGWAVMSLNHIQWLIPVLILAELSVPVIAERAGGTPWHGHHLSERYGLLGLIVMGESLRAAALAFQEASQTPDAALALYGVGAMAIAISAGMWWIYFWPPHHHSINQSNFWGTLRYGYLHYFIFATIAAFAAGVEVISDTIAHKNHVGEAYAGLSLSIPVGLFILAVWFVVIRDYAPMAINLAMPAVGLVTMVQGFLPFSMIAVAMTVTLLVATLVMYRPLDYNRSHAKAEARLEP
ncbi:MAG: low temperature requirement protein A [Rothia sp. (in: high G+C Gram-positive bacteria)]|uniref:low temperature requirement protein A n=1 Tax=Rothia sp. (in: high G+C Gram-positive bacteria) TaxID=1885016 RepID=UPI0026DF9D7F|nr:low temperature requirement protein A [Rothia sp. (in: high G+C Gram-positive bacteria)]MDO5750331.1 low temperature requirement protein A [Rothia sp. (in: high G+C Gram-positive bacteria)]